MAALVRRHDRDRFQTALFAPVVQREALLALYAFNYEIARVREAVREPMLGRIRLQWWREAIAAACEGGAVRPHEVVMPLTAAIRGNGLSRAHLDALIDARESDLEADGPATLAALETYCEGSSARLMLLAGEILGLPEGAASAPLRAAGIAYGLAGLLRAMPFHAAAGRSYIPGDLAADNGLDPADYRSRRSSPALRRVAEALADRARQRLAAARRDRATIPRRALGAALPAVVASRYLARLERAGHDPFAQVLAAPDPLQSWRLLAAVLRNRF
ncbi:MAG: phytoene/squalene synthase family protein [Stellaceae bacterium]